MTDEGDDLTQYEDADGETFRRFNGTFEEIAVVDRMTPVKPSRRRRAWWTLRAHRRRTARAIGNVLLGSRGEWGKLVLDDLLPPRDTSALSQQMQALLAPYEETGNDPPYYPKIHHDA